MNSQTTLSQIIETYTESQNTSLPHGCIELKTQQREFLPGNNTDNIVTQSAVLYASRVRSTMLQILFLIGGPANVINMAVFFKQGLRDRVNLLLFSLSLADGLYLFVSLLHYSGEFYAQFSGTFRTGSPLHAILVNHLMTGFLGSIFVSFTLSSIIACERCYCVLRPLNYQSVLRTRTVAVVIVAVYCTVLSLSFVVMARYYVSCAYDPDTGSTSLVYTHREFYTKNQHVIDSMDGILFGAGFPVLMMVVVTVTTVVTTWKLHQIIAWRATSSLSEITKEIGLTKMLIGTSVLLIVCASPGCVFRVISLLLPDVNTGGRYQNFYFVCIRTSQVFFYINCSFNFFVYFVMGSRFRETFWALFRRKKELKKKNVQ